MSAQSSSDSGGGGLSLAGYILFAIVLLVFASYFIQSFQTVVQNTAQIYSNATMIPYATSGPLNPFTAQQVFNYTYNILMNPISVALLIVLGMVYVVLARRR